MKEQRTVKDQVKRFKGYMARNFIPNNPLEKEIYDVMEHALVPYVETLLKQIAFEYYEQGFLDCNKTKSETAYGIGLLHGQLNEKNKR